MRTLLHTLLSLIAFATTCFGVQSLVPWPIGLGLRAKMEYFEKHGDEFDALFIGSSRVFRDIMPRVIESELQAEGHTFKSFNLGVAAMKDFETNHLVRSVLEKQHAKLQWLFIESGDWNLSEETEANGQSRRTIEWHSPANARAVSESLSNSELALFDQLSAGHLHLAMFAQRFASYGRGRDVWNLFADQSSSSDDGEDSELGEADLTRDWGWQSLGPDRVPLDATRWKQQVKSIRRNETRGTGAGPVVLRKLPLDAIKSQIEFAQSKVPNVAYLSLPNSRGALLARVMSSLDIFPDYLSFDLPSQHPNLYALNRRLDANHLNELGATELSKLIAAQIAERLNR